MLSLGMSRRHVQGRPGNLNREAAPGVDGGGKKLQMYLQMYLFLVAKCMLSGMAVPHDGAVVCGSFDGALDNRGTGINRENKHLMDFVMNSMWNSRRATSCHWGHTHTHTQT